MMKLTDENYHSPKANRNFMSVSLFKSMVPWFGNSACQAKTVAKIQGKWQEEESKAMKVGSYIHSWAEHKLPEFTSKHPEIFKNNGELYADFRHADEMIAAIKKDDYFMKTLEGFNETIYTAELFGIMWKCKIDIRNEKTKTITDLKTTSSINRKQYNTFVREYQDFITYWGYDYQMAIYAEIERLANGREEGNYYVPHIAAVSKEDPPDKIVIHFPTNEEDWIQNKLEQVEIALQDIIPVWKGEEKPERCGRCEYCRSSKQLKKSIHYFDFISD